MSKHEMNTDEYINLCNALITILANASRDFFIKNLTKLPTETILGVMLSSHISSLQICFTSLTVNDDEIHEACNEFMQKLALYISNNKIVTCTLHQSNLKQQTND